MSCDSLPCVDDNGAKAWYRKCGDLVVSMCVGDRYAMLRQVDCAKMSCVVTVLDAEHVQRRRALVSRAYGAHA
jgi:hypothetical protein